MSLPQAEMKYRVDGECPDCGHKVATVWEAKPVDGEADLLTRLCLCPECGCWFQEDLRPVLQSVEVEKLLEDGETECWAESVHFDNCQLCGRPLEEDDDPYFGVVNEDTIDYDAEIEYQKDRDVEDGLLRRVFYCLDCRVENKETYRLERESVRVVRHGEGPEGSDRCPQCGSSVAEHYTLQILPSTFSVLCECHECGCSYQLETEEAFNQARIVVDRDSWFADGDHESLFLDPVVKDGDECPMCGGGVITRSADYPKVEDDLFKGLRRTRLVVHECRNCFTEYEDLYATRVVSVEVLAQGNRVKG